MNIREEIEHCIDSNSRLSGFDKITEYGIDVLEGLFKKLAKQMCADQKQICLDNVRISAGFDWTTETLNPYVIRESVMQSPYPEELQ